jgi:putative ABC transport system ATP-binding protein
MLLQKRDPKERRAKALEILEEVGLKDYVHRRPTEMSGGQQQRVAVARAIVSEPKLILADEPTANLDSITANKLLDLMQHMNEKHGITFVFSTHDQKIIERAKRIVRLEDGKIV